MTLRWGTGADLMVVSSNADDAFAQLGWYGLPTDPAGSNMRVTTPGRFNYGNAIAMDNSSTSGGNTVQASYLLKHGVTFNEFYTGAAMYVPAGEAYQKPFLGVARTGVAKITAMFTTFGQIELWLGRPHDVGATLLATSNPGDYFNDVWLYFEVGGTLKTDATGEIIVRVNTEEVIHVVATVTNPSGTLGNSVMIGYGEESSVGSGNTGQRWDDMYMCDGLGTDNNTFLGNIRVQGLRPNAAGASTDFTPFGAVTNWQAANNTAIDDTKYVYSIAPGDYDLYEIEALVNTPQVFGVQVTGFYRQDDATQRSVKNVIFSGATLDAGAQYFTNAVYTATTDMWEEDPNTTNPWLYPDVNNLQIGPKVES